jgi:hypothetical protein
MSLTYGEIDIELNDAAYTLRPTLKAMKKIQAKFGGVRGALEALGHLNLEAVAAIVAAGCDAQPREVAEIEENVFAHGVGNATEQVVPFVTLLINPRGDTAKDAPAKKDGAGKASH